LPEVAFFRVAGCQKIPIVACATSFQAWVFQEDLPMTALRYFDKSEYEEAKKRADEVSASQGKLTRRGATMWLRGQDGQRSDQEITEASKRAFEARKRFMVTDEVIERTKDKITKHADATGKAFRRGMPSGAKFAPSLDMEPRLLEKYPHLGVCEFAKIPMRIEGREVIVALYVGNFTGTISTKPDEDFFKITDTSYAEMYFAVAWRKDGEGEFEVATDVGHKGVMFQTDSKTKAFDNSVFLSTGRKVSDWQQRIKAAQEKLFDSNVRTLNSGFGM
jgi:hypothetical protein